MTASPPTAPLRFQSPQIRVRVLDESPEHSEVLDDWHFTEHFSESGRRDRAEHFGNYHVAMERSVKQDEDAGSVFISGEFHAQALEKAWLYGTGATMGGHGYEFMLPPARLPQSWTSNASEVLPESDWNLLRDGASFAASRRIFPSLPLKACIEVMKALADADDITLQLSAYHYGAVTTLDTDLHFLLFAQGLELGRELLSGKSKKDKEAQLPNGVRSRLRHGLDWLFSMANQRRQTRHALEKREAIVLKEEFDAEEEEVFLEGAHLVLQHLVSSRLGLPLVLFENDTTMPVV